MHIIHSSANLFFEDQLFLYCKFFRHFTQTTFETRFYFWVKCMLQIQQCYVFKFSWNSWCKYFKFYANISSNPQILSESLLGFMFIHNDSQINKSADVLYFINASRIDFVNTTGSINIAL